MLRRSSVSRQHAGLHRAPRLRRRLRSLRPGTRLHKEHSTDAQRAPRFRPERRCHETRTQTWAATRLFGGKLMREHRTIISEPTIGNRVRVEEVADGSRAASFIGRVGILAAIGEPRFFVRDATTGELYPLATRVSLVEPQRSCEPAADTSVNPPEQKDPQAVREEIAAPRDANPRSTTEGHWETRAVSSARDARDSEVLRRIDAENRTAEAEKKIVELEHALAFRSEMFAANNTLLSDSQRELRAAKTTLRLIRERHICTFDAKKGTSCETCLALQEPSPAGSPRNAP